MPTRQSSNLRAVNAGKIDFTAQLKTALLKEKPWGSIIDFVTHKSFLNFKSLYPRQATLLKLIFLETEHMTAFDIDVIGEWTEGFTGAKDSYGVQPDIWQRIEYLKARNYRRFPHIQAVLGRRASKGLTGSILGAEAIAHMITLDNPQRHYGIAENKEMYLTVTATMETQAREQQFADIRNMIIRQDTSEPNFFSPYISVDRANGLNLYTPNDLRRIARMHASGVPLNNEMSSIRCKPTSSNSASGRGSASFALFLDEFAHFLETDGTRSSSNVYAAAKPSLDQFGKDQLMYVASSPYSKVGKFFELYTQGSVYMDEFLAQNPEFGTNDRDEALDGIVNVADPTKFIVQLASWQLYEDWEKSGVSVPGNRLPKAVIEYDDALKIEEKQDKEKFKVERRGQFAEVIDGYLDPDLVDLIFEPYKGDQLRPLEYGRMDIQYHAHLDPGLTNDNFALAIGHREYADEKDRFGELIPHVVIDLLHVWKAEDFPNHTIDYEVVKADIDSYIKRFHSLKTMTFDQWNSEGFISFFNKMYQGKIDIHKEDATQQVNQQRYDTFKMAVNGQMVHSYRDNFFRENGSLLENELKFLQKKNGKVDHQSVGPVTTKDLSDCVVIVTNRIMKDYFHGFQRALLDGLQPVATNLSLPSTNDFPATMQGHKTQQHPMMNQMGMLSGSVSNNPLEALRNISGIGSGSFERRGFNAGINNRLKGRR